MSLLWNQTSPPASSRDFQRAALQRLTTAEFLLEYGYTLEAMYLAGYTVECSLKALILDKTPSNDRQETLRRIASGSKMHNWDILAGMLKDLGSPVPQELRFKFRRFPWSTDLRYQTGHRRASEARGFLKMSKTAYDWVKGQLP